ncbi:MAG: serine hydrolase [Nocardioides sp.]|uniref:serine hydrolase domain-containing protein n=1 Tax=Nocardioides sp. TaxID=35761 RepID=UPI0023A4B3DA|nr:serine hydrolase domain-containing protein [Nocardioides sp.]MDE0774646.1 serine hydrolase [Nocardioides sp.]
MSAGLEARLLRLQVEGRLPSIVGALVRDGEVVETAGIGAEPGTAYRIGSITKTLTAVLVLQLRDAGRLSLADPLGAHLPGAPYGEVSIADLLGHTGGLQSEPAGPWWERSEGGSFADLQAANDGTGAVAPAGSWFHYSNLGYGLLGEVVARAHGTTWWSTVADRLLSPLGMSRTTYAPVAPHADGFSVEHFTGRLTPEPLTDTGAMAAAGQAWSTLADLARWSRVLAGRCPEVLAPATAAEMATERAGSGYGLGLRLVEVAGRPWCGHTGSMPGFLASLFVDPARADATVVLSNATTGLACEAVPETLTAQPEAAPPEAPWQPTLRVPEAAADALGLWFWGNTAIEHRWHDGGLEQRHLQGGGAGSRFELRDGRLVGVRGYHRGEVLTVHPTHLECATFIHTRVPYDPRAPIPG